MKKKNLIVIVLSVLICIVIGMILALYNINIKTDNLANVEFYNGLPVNISHAMFMYDTSTPEKAIGASDYVFIAKVNGIIRTEYKNPISVEVGLFKKKNVSTPYTIYSIDVIKNIKRELITNESIEFIQYGGLNEDEKSYTFLEDGRLLEPNKYYIIMADTWGGDGGIVEIAQSSRIIELENDYNPITNNSTSLVNAYENAYKNEVIPTNENGISYNGTGFISKYDINYKK